MTPAESTNAQAQSHTHRDSSHDRETADGALEVGWIDGHLDLAYLAAAGRDLLQPVRDPEVGCVSYPALAEAGVRLIFGTLFTETGAAGQPAGYRDQDDLDGARGAALAQLEWYESEEAAGRLRILRRRSDLSGWSSAAAISVVLLMEGADPIASPDDAPFWFERGVRIVGMSWAHGSRYSGGNARGGPLTRAGRALVAALDDLGILHDASHLSDQSFDELFGLTDRLVVATHSNCRALLAPKQRHLDDDRIRRVADRGGVIGLNLFAAFLAEGRDATLDDAIRHARHVARIGGPQATALGSDLDGGFPATKLPRGLRHPRELRGLGEALLAAGASRSDLEAFARGNWLRVLEHVLPR